MAPRRLFAGVPSERAHRSVQPRLVLRVHAAERVEDLAVDGAHGLLDALAAVALSTVAQLDRLMRAGRGAGGNRGAAEGAVLEADIDLDRRLPRLSRISLAVMSMMAAILGIPPSQIGLSFLLLGDPAPAGQGARRRGASPPFNRYRKRSPQDEVPPYFPGRDRRDLAFHRDVRRCPYRRPGQRVATGESKHHDKMQALFSSPDQYMMYRVQMHEATRGMAHEQKRAYRKSEFQKMKAMTGAQRDAYLSDLQAKWNALPPERKAHIEQRMASKAANPHHGHHGQYDQSGNQMSTPQ